MKLKASAGDELQEITLTLSVTLPATYPKTLPHCRILTYGDGVPNSTRKAIERNLVARPKELLGQEMIYELATSIQDHLDAAALKFSEVQDVPTLDEERAMKDAETRRKAAELHASEEQQQKDVEDEEARILDEMVRNERTRMTKLQKVSSTSQIDGSFETGLSFDQDIKARTREGKFVAFRAIVDKAPFRRGPVTSVFTATVSLEESVLPFLALKECAIGSRGSEDHVKKVVQALETGLETLVNLAPHTGVLKPLGFRLEKNSQTWNIHILEPLVPRGSLRDILETVDRLDIRNVRAWTIDILEALDFLHRHRIVHGRLTPDNILLDRSEAGDTILKLSDAFFQQELHSVRTESDKFSSAASAYWIAPEIASNSSNRPSNAKDVWDLGVVLLQMVFGLDVQTQHTSPSTLIESLDLSESFEALLHQFFKADPKKRPGSFTLLANEFLRSIDPVIESTSPMSLSRITSTSTVPTTPRTPRARRESTAMSGLSSRYASDFAEVGRLGKGGFGEVVRARNKLDGTMYAIKKITQSSSAALSGVLSEIMLLSRLNNPFIVRYYTAWLEEEGVPRTLVGPDPDPSSTDISDSLSQLTTSNTQELDFISSRGHPAIEFGYDSDQEDAVGDTEDETSQEESEPNPAPAQDAAAPEQRRRRSSVISIRVTLYIQMEYCDKQTLRDLIRGDLHSNVEECWRLFRQILEGLAYIHTNGVIHRDLKPENVFITLDQSNTVRIGDFGLARPGEATEKLGAGKGFVDPRLTASIGTSIYVAPEVKSSGGGSYNEKADMYSLGVILFEMSYPLKTGMERAQTLGDLRQYHSKLPLAFESLEKELQGEIIKSLVKHKVSERPSSQELLRSGRIPSHVEDETIRTALRSLSDKNSAFYARFLSELFNQSRDASNRDTTLAKDYTFDFDLQLKSASEGLLHCFIRDQLIKVFRRHGAVETQRPQLLPSSTSSLYGDTAVRLLDSAGSVVHLPYDLTLPFARLLAKQDSKDIARKSFTFGSVFREASAGHHPRMHGEVDFDIVSENSLDLALREAEVIKVMDEIIENIPSLAVANVSFQLSHSRLLNHILKFCAIPEDKIPAVKQIISKLNIGQWNWNKIKTELRSPTVAVPSTCLEDLSRFDFRDTHTSAIAKLRALLQSTEELESTFRHLEAIVAYLGRFRVKNDIFVCPLASVNERFYSGNILFQCVYRVNKKNRVLCAGGRYDRLIQDQRVGSKTQVKHAVGFNLAWENLVESVTRFQNEAGKNFLKKSEEVSSALKMKRCDVLIDSADPATLRSTGIKIVQELWANDISAELVIDANEGEATSHNQHSKEDDRHTWIVLIKQDETLRVRSMISKEDTEVRGSELLNWLRMEIRERDRIEGKAERSKSQQIGVLPEATYRESEVIVLTSQSRGKKTNRRNIVEDAQARTQELAESFLDCPIAAVEIKDELLEALRDTRLSDPESWRRYIQNAPLADRQYLTQLHQLLLDKAEAASAPTTGKGARSCWVYNFRTRACLLYDLGKTADR